MLFQTSTLQNSKPLVQIGSLVYPFRQISSAPRLDPQEAAKRKRSGEHTYGGGHRNRQEARSSPCTRKSTAAVRHVLGLLLGGTDVANEKGWDNKARREAGSTKRDFFF